MKVAKAVITAAGRNQRHLPLQTLVDQEGFPRYAFNLLLEEVASAGIREIGIVIAPGDKNLFDDKVDVPHLELHFIEQQEPGGYGHAIHCARPFTGDDPFLLMVSDHLYVTDAEESCARQLVQWAERMECTVSAVEPTHESKLRDFGAVGGVLAREAKTLYDIDTVLEKPTPTLAEQELLVPGLRTGHYLCFFGMHVLKPGIMEILGDLLAQKPETRMTLSDALRVLPGNERYLAAVLKGRRYDLENRYGMLTAQIALALNGKYRDEVLTQLVELLAESRR